MLMSTERRTDMEKISNWENVKASEGFTALPAGGYVMKVVGVKVTTSAKGKEMMVLALDVAEGDYKDYFRSQWEFRKKYNAEAKFPCNYYMLTGRDDDAQLSRFKGVINNFCKDNNIEWNWDEQILKGKLIGGIIGEEEYITNAGDVRTSLKVVNLRSKENIEKAPAPALKKLANSGAPAMDIGYGVPSVPTSDDIPF